jgi:hypothetical protein
MAKIMGGPRIIKNGISVKNVKKKVAIATGAVNGVAAGVKN